MNNKPTILISNDDGITAKGIETLVRVANEFGHVYVVAPNSPQSAQGHSITIEDPIRIYKNTIFGADVVAYECSGTPADCIKIAKNVVLKGADIDLCLSGINHGSNASTNVIYSGTMSAAMEASMEGIPAIGFSLLDFAADANFDASEKIVRQIIGAALKEGLGKTKLLNVNIPNLAYKDLKGIRICRQAKGYWIEEFKEGLDPLQRPYYWLTGKYEYQDSGEDTDIWALENHFVSVVPVKHDLTMYEALDTLDHFSDTM
jgi:5'-nucleotidase